MSFINSYIEILEVVKNNKLRTLLTGFSVMWGIWILLIMLGSVEGFFNASKKNMGSRAVNSMNIYPGKTSIPYAGYKTGRSIDFKKEDLDALSHINKHIIGSTFAANSWGKVITYNEISERINLNGVGPTFQYTEGMPIRKGNGRFINEIDEKQKRKVVVIDENLKKTLFQNKNPLGEQVLISEIPFTVIGVHSGAVSWGQTSTIIPFNTFIAIFKENYWYRLSLLIDKIGSTEVNDKLKEEIGVQLAKIKNYSPEDKNAIFISSQYDNAKLLEQMTTAISLFFWIIGISILAVGIVGVSNIMLISVKERTNEIGIRKALGAKPRSIISMIVSEALVITLVFGYLGMFLGIFTMEILNLLIIKYKLGTWKIANFEGELFSNPTIDFSIAISATIVIVIAGSLAGFFPARKASKISAIDAMRN